MSWLAVLFKAPSWALVTEVAHSTEHARQKTLGKPDVHLE